MGFISRLNLLYTKFVKAGTEDIADPEQIFRIELVNKLSLLVAVLMVPIVVTVLSCVIFTPFLLACFIIEYLINLSVLQWNKLKKHRTASLFFYFNQCFFVAFFGILFGGVQLQFAIIFLVSIIFLIERDNKIRTICYLLAVLDLAVLQLVYFYGVEPAPLSFNSEFVIQSMVIGGVMVILYFLSIPYRHGNDLRFSLVKENQNTQHYTANIAHEMRSPLNSMSIWVEKLEHELQKKEMNKQTLALIATMLKTGTRNVQGIISNSLSLAEIGAGKKPENVMEHFMLKEFLVDLIEFNSVLGIQREISFVLNMDKMPAIIVSDKNKIAQILNNLFSNAIKFSKKKTKVQLIVEPVPARRAWSVKVINHSNSSVNVNMEEIFSPYVSCNTNSHVPDSTGLGLFITKEKVHELGGEITFTKNIQENTVEFTVIFPLMLGKLEMLQQGKLTEEEMELIRRVLPGQKVLIADDDAITARATGEELNRLGMIPSVVSSGNAMLLRVAADKPDVIIMDYHMPGLRAEQAIVQLKENPDTKNIPVIVTTGAVYNHNGLNELLELGADDYVLKPIEIKNFLVTISRIIHNKKITVS
ncbi:response regulator [Pseudoflavitalea sp. G-6-1-2]|uniref:ATP-binding response regulator n=1 Tax=Pseudoflavitalea sp. G-6-1-2 TaxID=2728841 RepID=UPI00146B53A8|nr:hybrid sensor histidine kinase/response regulator [Pseudoflavitalea sp. G-6-1-2]NML22368.1 response regulator [Pseudoflavitalea sp. G-6-1-2]